jgi:hypothetical protein
VFDPHLIFKAGRLGFEFELARVVPDNPHICVGEAARGLSLDFKR